MTEPLLRLADALADRYRIEQELGQGGMATVYLAEDLKHHRKVAIKVLHPELSAVLGPDRFLKEIELTAALQHPHILPLFDSGATDGLLFYVMPFVEGETLRSRLTREHQLPVPEALRIASDVADALGYAHKRGIIHRDIKPENILLHEGRPQVADFGIALAVQQAGGSRMTQTGISLGTPQYMAPEQAMGDRGVDARADIYALGAVTYEMLTGEPPFSGPTSQAVVAKLMIDAPRPPSELRKTVPPHVNDAVLTALEKLPADRFPSAADFTRALGDPGFTHTLRSTSARRLEAPRSRSTWVLIGGIAAVAALGGAAITSTLRKPASAPAPVVRFELPLPDSISSPVFGGDVPVFPARNGRLLWYVGGALYERSLDGLTNQRLRDLEGAPRAVIEDEAPDGTELLMISGIGGPGAAARGGGGGLLTLRIVPLRGGPSRVVVDSADFAVWGADGFIYYSYYWPGVRKSGIARVPVQGGAVDTLAAFRLDSANVVPQNLTLLPNGRGLVVTLGVREAPELAAFDLRHRSWHRLGSGGPAVQYVEPGYLIYASGRSILAAPFDLDRFAFTRPALPLADVEEAAVHFAARGGVLVFRGTSSGIDAPPLVIRSRQGGWRLLPNVLPGWVFTSPAASPDGRRFVVVGGPLQPNNLPLSARRGLPNTDLFVYELPSGPMTHLATPSRKVAPTWLPGGREIGFTRFGVDTPTTWTVMRQRWDGSAPATPVYSRSTVLGETSWLPNGQGFVVLYVSGPESPTGGRGRANTDLGLFLLSRPDSIQPLVTSSARDGSPAVSPDGRYLAYDSDESGRREVYIRPLAGGARRQVSLAGGGSPRWAWSGRELFFNGNGTWMSARIRVTGELSVGEITPLFEQTFLGQFAPAPLPGDSQFVAFLTGEDGSRTRGSVVVLVNLEQALARLFAVGAKQ